MSAAAHVDCVDIDFERRASCLGRAVELEVRCDVRVQEDHGARERRGDLFEVLQPLATHLRLEGRKAGQIAARTSQAFDKPAANRIADRHEYDGDRPVDRAHCITAGLLQTTISSGAATLSSNAADFNRSMSLVTCR